MAIFDEKIEIRERCKGVHCVDLGEGFPTRIYLQKSASIQPRTSPSKFGWKIQFNIHFTPQRRLDLPDDLVVARGAAVALLREAPVVEVLDAEVYWVLPALALVAVVQSLESRPMFVFSNCWLLFSNFERPVLGCTEAEVCK